MLDSLNYLPFALSALPKAFEIPDAKGYFPHLFNCMGNWDYVGEVPDAWFYGPGGMKVEARDKFYKWYNDQKGVQFDFRRDLVAYCKKDVEILRIGCMKFRSMLQDLFEVCPFTAASTIASTCMEIFRRRFLKPNTIAVVPHLGYRKNDRHSIVAMKWLKWLSCKHVLDIQHALNGGEVKCGNYKFDGQLRSDKRVVYEFYGCVFHGCPTCFPNRKNKLPKSNLTAEDAYRRTKEREYELQMQGYDLQTMWECDLSKELKSNVEMRDFFKGVDLMDPLDPRDAFFGGRTNCTQLYYKCKPGEKMGYCDVTSLYPWCCKYGVFPVGHPKIITENFEPVTIDCQPYRGLIKCCVLPPRGLFHPVLPVRSGGKLMFPLCNECVASQQQTRCQHSDEQRQLWGTWTTLELYKALELDYKLIRVFEVYHYEEWSQFDGVNDDTGLFTKYINAFLKIKQEASGWPKWVKTDADKNEYVRLYEVNEGIKLDKGKIKRNEALRSLAKLGLNSFWGKFGQRTTMTKDVYCSSLKSLYDIVFDAANEVHAIKLIGPKLVFVKYCKTDDYVEEIPNTNPIIAAFVTAAARLKLYTYLERLGSAALYFDTDSCIYVARPDAYVPALGDYLGDMTDELDGGWITEFVSGGPKVYAYKMWDPKDQKEKSCVKVRGITLNSTTGKRLNFSVLKELVLHYLNTGTRDNIDIVMDRIQREPDRTVVTKTLRKRYRVVYDKRRVLRNGSTLPYGY